MQKPDFNTYIISDDNLLNRLYSYVDNLQPEITVLDVETNSQHEKIADLYGIGLCFSVSKAFYIPWRRPDGTKIWTQQKELEIRNWIEVICSKTKLIGHNIIYDVLVLENNLELYLTDRVYSDTILQKHAIDEERPFALKEIGVKYLGNWADKAQEKLKDEVSLAGGKWTMKQKDMYLASTETLGEYCCWDVILTLLLFNKFEKQIFEDGLASLFYTEETMPLYREVTIDMKRKGFPINLKHFKKLEHDIGIDINLLEDHIISDIHEDVKDFEQSLLDKDVPIKATGNFPKALAEVLQFPLPINKKTGKVTLAEKAILAQKEALNKDFHFFYDWLLNKQDIKKEYLTENIKLLYCNSEDPIREAQEKLFFGKKINEGKRHVFNLGSTDHIIELIINTWGFAATEKTDGGKPKVDNKFLEMNAEGNRVIQKLIEYKQLNKIKSTYIEGILDRQLEGMIYTSMLQFGTISGRYASRNPNLQNLPRPKDADSGLSELVLKYSNAIREGFIPPTGYKLVDSDYSALEPRCFSAVSGDKKLIQVWQNGEDLYSRVAIDVFGLEGVSANPKAINYLKKVNPEFRQKAKLFCLAVAYGAEAGRISKAMKCTYQEADDIIKRYLNAYPGLKKYMYKCNSEAKTKGKVTSYFGRIRHLDAAQSLIALYGNELLNRKYAQKMNLEDERWKLKNQLNNAKNFPIQGMAAHIVNRAAIAVSRAFKTNNIDGYISLQVHDQLISIVRTDQCELACKLVQEAMENTTKILVPLIAEPEIANNMRESH